MASDSLALSNYTILARFLTGRLERRIEGQKLVSVHNPSKYTPKDEIMLLEHLRKEREVL